MNEQQRRDTPTLPIGFNDLAALRSVILGYLAYVRRSRLPVPERQQQIRLLDGVYRRLTGIPADALEVHIPLEVQEIQALNSAMLVFAAFVRQKVAASRGRDETLQSLERLRLALVGMLSN